MKTISILINVLFLSAFSYAQQTGNVVATIKGKVVDAKTNEPVSYTNIGLEGTYFGTACDVEGNFELKIPDEMANKEIYFSAVGFISKKLQVKSLFDKSFNIIKIEPQSYEIDRIEIAAQSKVLIRILQLTSEDIPYNFVSEPFNLTGKYINKKTIDDTITIVQTADLLIYDHTGYSDPSKLNAFKNLKYSVKKVQWDVDSRFSGETTNMDELLELDWARSAFSVLNPDILMGFQLKLDSEPVINGKDCWVISFAQEKPTLAGSGDFYATGFEGKITIVKENYSVVRIEGKVQSNKNNRQGKSLAIGNPSKNFYENVSYQFSTDYENMKPEKIILEKQYTFHGKKISEYVSLQMNQIQTTNLSFLGSRDYFIGDQN